MFALYHMSIYDINMIRSFACKDTKAVFNGKPAKRFLSFLSAAQRKLQLLDSAYELADLRSPPGNRLEALTGNRSGQHSIRINRQWRLCFSFGHHHAHDVEIIDYH